MAALMQPLSVQVRLHCPWSWSAVPKEQRPLLLATTPQTSGGDEELRQALRALGLLSQAPVRVFALSAPHKCSPCIIWAEPLPSVERPWRLRLHLARGACLSVEDVRACRRAALNSKRVTVLSSHRQPP